MNQDIRIETLKQALMESTIEPSERDALADDLEYAQSINGSPNEALQGIKRMTISNVRREMLAHMRMKRHELDCPFRKGAEVGGQAAPITKTLAVIRALTPFRWPIALAVFSPFAGEVATRIIGFFKG
jgi:hypothetical protein